MNMSVRRWMGRATRSGSRWMAGPSRGLRRLTLEPLEDRRLLAVLDVGLGARYTTIQSAVDAARPGDVVLVGDGQYAESVDLSRMGIVRGGSAGDLLCDGVGDSPRAAAPEAAAWSDWTGSRLSLKRTLGEGLMAAAAWQCIAACDAVAQGTFAAANVSLVGGNQQAIGARFVRDTHRQPAASAWPTGS